MDCSMFLLTDTLCRYGHGVGNKCQNQNKRIKRDFNWCKILNVVFFVWCAGGAYLTLWVLVELKKHADDDYDATNNAGIDMAL